ISSHQVTANQVDNAIVSASVGPAVAVTMLMNVASSGDAAAQKDVGAQIAQIAGRVATDQLESALSTMSPATVGAFWSAVPAVLEEAGKAGWLGERSAGGNPKAQAAAISALAPALDNQRGAAGDELIHSIDTAINEGDVDAAPAIALLAQA